jgi:hypothetical protein
MWRCNEKYRSYRRGKIMKKFNQILLCAGLCLSCTQLTAMQTETVSPAQSTSIAIQGLLPKETYKARAAHYLYCVFFGESLDKPLEIAYAKWKEFEHRLDVDPSLRRTTQTLRAYLRRNIGRLHQSKNNYYRTQLEGYLRERKRGALDALAHLDGLLLLATEDAHIEQTTVIESMYQELSCDPLEFDPITRIPYFFTAMVTQNLECGLLISQQKPSQACKITDIVEMSQIKIKILHLVESIELAQAILDAINPLEAID